MSTITKRKTTAQPLSDLQRQDIRNHALYQRREERWQAAQAEAVTNGARFPADPYPVTLAEVCARQDAVEARLAVLEAKARKIGPHDPIGPGLMPVRPYREMTEAEKARMIEAAKGATATGDELWAQVAGNQAEGVL